MRDSFAKQIANIPGATMEETDEAFNFSNGQFVLKPKRKRETLGFLKCGPTFATFAGSRIEYADMTINSDFATIETEYSTFSIHGEA